MRMDDALRVPGRAGRVDEERRIRGDLNRGSVLVHRELRPIEGGYGPGVTLHSFEVFGRCIGGMGDGDRPLGHDGEESSDPSNGSAGRDEHAITRVHADATERGAQSFDRDEQRVPIDHFALDGGQCVPSVREMPEDCIHHHELLHPSDASDRRLRRPSYAVAEGEF